MSVPRRLLPVVAVVALLGSAASARADEPAFSVSPQVTDPAIVDTTPTRGSHLVWLTPDTNRRVKKLLVFLPTGGPTNVPTEFKALGTEAGRLGYHTIVLAYRNEAPIAAMQTATPPGCGNSADPRDAPLDCAIQIRREILDGSPASPLVNINPANSIYNRLNKLLEYLVLNRPASEGWAQFREANGQPKWAETVIAGSSLGAGQAALIASEHPVLRASLLHGWADASHGWVARGITPKEKWFTLIHAHDNFFERTCHAYFALDLAPSCPLAGHTVIHANIDPANPLFVENRPLPFGSPMLVFNLTPGSFAGTGDWYHQSTSRDGWIAKEPDGITPSRILVNAWRVVLGDRDADTYIDLVDNCDDAPNPVQTDDRDGDGIGDACDLAFDTPGTVGGSVGATLSLALGTAASFGPFTAGVAKDYLATATATVTSTAGDAALTVTDPSATAPGHLVNGAFSLPQALQARAVPGSFATVGSAPALLLTYTGPTSNNAVSLEFKQGIGANDALRSGTYSKTLTYTLSTTTP